MGTLVQLMPHAAAAVAHSWSYECAPPPPLLCCRRHLPSSPCAALACPALRCLQLTSVSEWLAIFDSPVVLNATAIDSVYPLPPRATY